MRLPVVATCLLTVCAAFAEPNFGGEWKMNSAKSKFGGFPGPDRFDQKIVHQEPNITVTTTQAGQQGEFTFEAKYTTDGKETTNKIGPGELKSTGKWEGNLFHLVSKGSFNGNEFTLDDKWNLSEDGKTFTLNRKFSGQMGEAEQTIVLEKQ